MIIVSNKAIKFFEFILRMKIRAIAFWPFIILAPTTKITKTLINHEKIHLRQQIEMLIIPFYVWYMIEFYLRGYWNISFEREAYANESNASFLKQRKFFNFLKYLKK